MRQLQNEMTYNGNHVFHYTSFDAALRIIVSGKLRFGSFDDMNDIAEVKRDLFTNIDKSKVREILSEYMSISLTDDSNHGDRGFEIDVLWGHYADKGNGVCLVFDKSKIIETYRKTYSCKGVPENLNVEYQDLFNFGLDFNGSTEEEVRKEIGEHIKEIFYIKDDCWIQEQEVRLVTINNRYIPIDNSLLGAILCLPKIDKIETSEQYRILKSLQTVRSFKIYRYTTINGEKTLCCGDKLLYPILGLDQDIYFE